MPVSVVCSPTFFFLITSCQQYFIFSFQHPVLQLLWPFLPGCQRVGHWHGPCEDWQMPWSSSPPQWWPWLSPSCRPERSTRSQTLACSEGCNKAQHPNGSSTWNGVGGRSSDAARLHTLRGYNNPRFGHSPKLKAEAQAMVLDMWRMG